MGVVFAGKSLDSPRPQPSIISTAQRNQAVTLTQSRFALLTTYPGKIMSALFPGTRGKKSLKKDMATSGVY